MSYYVHLTNEIVYLCRLDPVEDEPVLEWFYDPVAQRNVGLEPAWPVYTTYSDDVQVSICCIYIICIYMSYMASMFYTS